MNHKPWQFRLDINYDGSFTISDVWILLAQLFYLPGDLIIYQIINFAPSAATFMELSYHDYHGILSGIVSFFSWILAISIVIALCIDYSNSNFASSMREKNANRDKEDAIRRRRELGYDDTPEE